VIESGEEPKAVPEHDGMDDKPVLIDETIFGFAYQMRANSSLDGVADGSDSAVASMLTDRHGRKSRMENTRQAKKRTGATDKASAGFTADERAAMKERARELKAEARANQDRAAGESDLLAKIAEMPGQDRAMAERLHAIITASAPGLSPKTWYGMPAYARDGKVVCFFKSADKFKSRYATLGFEETANLDDGAMWPTSFALTELTTADEATIAALVKKAVS
jgi:uncharacterized protein YdhG (YjbR/CyaY superfamily)